MKEFRRKKEGTNQNAEMNDESLSMGWVDG